MPDQSWPSASGQTQIIPLCPDNNSISKVEVIQWRGNEDELPHTILSFEILSFGDFEILYFGRMNMFSILQKDVFSGAVL